MMKDRAKEKIRLRDKRKKLRQEAFQDGGKKVFDRRGDVFSSGVDEKVRKLCEAAFEGIILMEDGVVSVANEQVAEMFGYELWELTGMKVVDLFAPDSKGLIGQHIASGRENRYEVQALRKDGSFFPAEVMGKQIVYGGRNIRAKAIRDLSEQKQKEREKQNLLSMFAHDMKNPLIVSESILTRLLSGKAGGPLSEQHSERLQAVKDELAKLGKLIINFLEYSRIEATKQTPEMEWIDIFSLVLEITEKATTEAKRKGLDITCELDGSQPLVRADRDMISRVVTNLIDNAFKHTGPGGSIRVRGSSQDENVTIEIIDSGRGILEDHLPFIFDAFYKVSPNSEGSGLGLAIAQKIIKAHGGQIWVESAPGRGSTFSFTLPRQ